MVHAYDFPCQGNTRDRIASALWKRFASSTETMMTWCYLDVREALAKAKELLLKLEQERHLVRIGYFS